MNFHRDIIAKSFCASSLNPMVCSVFQLLFGSARTDQFRYIKILTWLPGLGESDKRNVFISEPQGYFFCFILPNQGWTCRYRNWSIDLLGYLQDPYALKRWTCNSEVLTSAPVLTSSWICSRLSRVQILGHVENCQLVCLRPDAILNPLKLDLSYLFQAFARRH